MTDYTLALLIANLGYGSTDVMANGVTVGDLNAQLTFVFEIDNTFDSSDPTFSTQFYDLQSVFFMKPYHLTPGIYNVSFNVQSQKNVQS